jgi:hypothetical protein
LKSKKKTYLLLALVIVVWSTIIYKVITGLNPELPELQTQQALVVNDFKISTKTDTFSIKILDRDPFLGTLTKKRVVTTVLNKTKPLQWHPVDYLGTIKNNNQKEQIFIVTIDGKQRLLKKGQTMDSIRLVYGNKNRVVLSYKNSQKAIKRKNK